MTGPAPRPAAEILAYRHPLCEVWQKWQRVLDADGCEYTEKPLADLPGDLTAIEADRCGLVARVAARVLAGEPMFQCPTIILRSQNVVTLIADGEPPAFGIKQDKGVGDEAV